MEMVDGTITLLGYVKTKVAAVCRIHSCDFHMNICFRYI